MKQTVLTFLNAKKEGKKLSMVTAYDYTTAKIVDSCGIDGVLVGDSLGMTMLGYKDTLSVTMEDMIHHTKAVSRGLENALLIGDMPFMSYHTSIYDAVLNAGRLIKEGRAQAVKLEGGALVVEQAKAIVNAQIPVMGHIGLTPQSVNAFGGFKVQGKDFKKAQKIIDDAKKLEDAGVFSIVLECVPAALSALISESVSVPTIGIGAGAGCDGQVLVYQDMMGMTESSPKFVKVFDNAGDVMRSCFTKYIEEINAGTFPAAEHTFKIDEEVLSMLKRDENK